MSDRNGRPIEMLALNKMRRASQYTSAQFTRGIIKDISAFDWFSPEQIDVLKKDTVNLVTQDFDRLFRSSNTEIFNWVMRIPYTHRSIQCEPSNTVRSIKYHYSLNRFEGDVDIPRTIEFIRPDLKIDLNEKTNPACLSDIWREDGVIEITVDTENKTIVFISAKSDVTFLNTENPPRSLRASRDKKCGGYIKDNIVIQRTKDTFDYKASVPTSEYMSRFMNDSHSEEINIVRIISFGRGVNYWHKRILTILRRLIEINDLSADIEAESRKRVIFGEALEVLLENRDKLSSDARSILKKKVVQ